MGPGAHPGPGAPPGNVRRWVLGARPRTLAAAAVPVLVGTAVGWWLNHSAHTVGPALGRVGERGGVIWWRAACAFVVALAIQVGTNYANDYSDGVRGTDEVRVGPLRLVASGLASPARRCDVRRWLPSRWPAPQVSRWPPRPAWWLVAVGAGASPPAGCTPAAHDPTATSAWARSSSSSSSGSSRPWVLPTCKRTAWRGWRSPRRSRSACSRRRCSRRTTSAT